MSSYPSNNAGAAPPYEPPPYSEQSPPVPHGGTNPAKPPQQPPGSGWAVNPPPPAWGPNPPPPPGWSPYPPSYGTVTVTAQPIHTTTVHEVILIGGCPNCRVGILEEEFSCLGLLCAILFFPLGILCCLAMRDKRCNNCGARY